jgi:hypothetical protein
MTFNSITNLQKLDKKVFKNITDYLTELQTIRIVGKPMKNTDGSVSVEFRHEIFCSVDYTFQVSGYMNQSNKVEKSVFFFSIIDNKDHKKVIKVSQKQHKSIVNLIKDKIIL